jgi:hypothetical protein
MPDHDNICHFGCVWSGDPPPMLSDISRSFGCDPEEQEKKGSCLSAAIESLMTWSCRDNLTQSVTDLSRTCPSNLKLRVT